MEVHFTPEQEAQLLRIATSTGTQAERLVRDAALRMLEEDARFRAAIREGIAQAERGQVRAAEEVFDRLAERFGFSADHSPCQGLRRPSRM